MKKFFLSIVMLVFIVLSVTVIYIYYAKSEQIIKDNNNTVAIEHNKTKLLYKTKQKECAVKAKAIEAQYEKFHNDKETISAYEKLLIEYKTYGGCEIKTKAKRYIYL